MVKKYWKRLTTSALIIAGAGYACYLAEEQEVPVRSDIASIVEKNNIQTPYEPKFTRDSYSEYLPENLEKKRKERELKRDKVKVENFINYVKSRDDVLMRVEPTFIDKQITEVLGLENLCEGACVYIEMEDGYDKYELQEIETTFVYRVCDLEITDEECTVEEWIMDGIYLVIGKNEKNNESDNGEILLYGKTASNKSDTHEFKYFDVLDEDKYNSTEDLEEEEEEEEN